MGSSCSSKQSEKDTDSLNSEESDSKDQYSVKPIPIKDKYVQPGEGGGGQGQKKSTLDQEQLKSNSHEGRTVVTPDSPSVTRLNSNQKKPINNVSQPKVPLLPDLDNLKEETRALVKGTISNCSLYNPEKRISICLLGSSLESSNCLDNVAAELHEQLVPDCNSQGWEINIICPQCLPPVFRSSHELSHIVSHYIQDEVFQNSSRMFVVFYVDSNAFELPQMISKEKFDILVKTDEALLSKWYTYDTFLNVFRLHLPQVHFEDLTSSDKSSFIKARDSWHKEYRKLVTSFNSTESIANDNSANLIYKIIKNSLINCEVKIYLKEELKDRQSEFENFVSNEDVTLIYKTSSGEATKKSITTPLVTAIKNEIENWTPSLKILDNGTKRNVLQEISEHNQRCKILISSEAKIKIDLDPIKQYLIEPSSNPFLICGDRGTGKSYICSQIAAECQQWNPLFHVIVRYSKTNQNSSSIDGIMYFLREHIAILYGTDFNSMNMSHLGSDIREIWKKASPERPLVIILDGMDELVAPESAIEIMLDLPENVKVILTLQSNSSLYTNLKTRIDEQRIMKLQPSKICMEEIFKSNFPEECDTSQSIIKIFSSATSLEFTSPVYIMILSQILMISKDCETNFPKSLEEVIEELFAALSLVFSREYLLGILGTMSLTKSGLTSSELVLLSKTLSRNHSFDWLSLRVLIWPLLRVRKENRINLIGWSNDYIRSLAYQHFLSSSQHISTCKQLLWQFVTNSTENNAFDVSTWNSKKDSLTHKRSFQEASALLEPNDNADNFFNYDWLKEKLKLCSPFKLLDDLTAACKISDDHELNSLREAIYSSIPSLIYNEDQIFSQIYGRLKWNLVDGSSCKLSNLIESITKDNNRIRFLTNSLCFSKVDSENQTYINAIFRISESSQHVVALSDSQNEVQVWNIVDNKIVRTLKGINQPRNLAMINSHKCLLLCGRELRIYDLNKGIFLMKLREVMNQKMPFFGLHNSDHVIALSRSRMYVNMMNLNEGNCVTTFKVGEDRFLSSLVVSENGKICVCGDDSQKPSALLVWDLESRKLLYDLRIPHHEFNTKLVAITTEGHYVCSISKENDDPAPNFIVVYDLQNGTLFKRWKPDVSIVSITISTIGTCVIVALEDSSIMAYDLVTGNVRWTALGHTFPPDMFKLDNLGSIVLSYNSTHKDQSIRVVDIHTGRHLASFTPDEHITACEVTSDGKMVLLALRGRPEIISLSLYRENESYIKSGENVQIYGDEEFQGETFEL